MKKTIVFIVVAVFTTAVGAAYGQSTADEAFSPRVKEKEKRLLQKLTPDQMQVIAQNAALFERLPDPGTDPRGALERILAAPGIQGMPPGEVSFAVMALAGRHLNEDLNEIMTGIGALKETRQAMQAALARLQETLGASKDTQRASAGSGGPARAAAAQPLQTAHYKIEYWKVAAWSPKALSGLSRQERLAEAGLLKAGLAELDGLLARMQEHVVRGKQRQQLFARELEGMVLRIREKPER